MIYLAPRIFKEIELDEIAKEEKRKERQEELKALKKAEREAERQRSRERQRRIAALKDTKQRRAVALKQAQERRAVAWKANQQRMKQEQIKQQTLAPLPAVADRRANVDIAKYKYESVCKTRDCIPQDKLLKDFLDDPYSNVFRTTCNVDIDEFKAKYYRFVVSAECLWAWCHEQMESLAFDPKYIMSRLVLVFGVPPKLAHVTQKGQRSYRFMKAYFKEWRQIWFAIVHDKKTHKMQPAVDNLWAYFRFWFCDFRMGAMMCHRAKLVDDEFEFAPKPVKFVNKAPDYKLEKYPVIDKALKTLYDDSKTLKAIAKKRAGQKGFNKLKTRYSTAGHRDNKYNDDEKEESKAGDGYDDSFKANDKGTDEVVASDKIDYLTQKDECKAVGGSNESFKDDDDDEDDDDDDHGSNAGNKRNKKVKSNDDEKKMKVRAAKGDKSYDYEYVYSEEEENQQDDDMSLVSSLCDFSII